MASITITINTDGEAFHEDAAQGLEALLSVGHEVGYILRRMATQFETDGEASPPRDSNDKIVGTVELID